MKKFLPAFLILLSSALLTSMCDSSDPYDPYRSVPKPFDIAGKKKVTLENGLIYYVVEEGKGDGEVTLRSTVDMFYTGRLTSNRIFDSSYIYGNTAPRKMYLPDNIRGFNYGAIGMKVGEKRRLIVPPALGYGDSPSNQYAKDTLIFDIELDFIYPQKITPSF